MILNLSQLREDYKATYRVDWRLGTKIDFLIQVTKLELKYHGRDKLTGKSVILLELLSAAKISLRTLQRWKRRYRLGGVNGLKAKTRGHKKAEQLKTEIKNRIDYYRKTYRWGSEVIQAHLLRDDGYAVTRYKIERYLDQSGLRNIYPCSTKKRQKDKKRRKHTKKVFVSEPGAHTQMDVKYQNSLLENKKSAYVYNFVDHASNWSFKFAYSKISAKNTEDFMERLLKECPFKIKRLQTDNGVEFTYKWASKNADDPKEHPLLRLCAREGIVHKLIPPGEKELQGLVERSHRQDDQELYSRIKPYDIEEFNRHLEEYYKLRNRGRRFKKLMWKSPNFWLYLYNIPVLAEQMFLRNKHKCAEKIMA